MEVKNFDVGFELDAKNDGSGSSGYLCLPLRGTGSNQFIGDDIRIKRIHFRGSLAAASTPNTQRDEFVFVALCYVKIPLGGSVPAFTDLFNVGLHPGYEPFCFPNPAAVDRFQVMWSMMRRTGRFYVPDAADGSTYLDFSKIWMTPAKLYTTTQSSEGDIPLTFTSMGPINKLTLGGYSESNPHVGTADLITGPTFTTAAPTQAVIEPESGGQSGEAIVLTTSGGSYIDGTNRQLVVDAPGQPVAQSWQTVGGNGTSLGQGITSTVWATAPAETLPFNLLPSSKLRIWEEANETTKLTNPGTVFGDRDQDGVSVNPGEYIGTNIGPAGLVFSGGWTTYQIGLPGTSVTGQIVPQNNGVSEPPPGQGFWTGEWVPPVDTTPGYYKPAYVPITSTGGSAMANFTTYHTGGLVDEVIPVVGRASRVSFSSVGNSPDEGNFVLYIIGNLSDNVMCSRFGGSVRFYYDDD